MIPHSVEQAAQVKHLGSFERRYRDSYFGHIFIGLLGSIFFIGIAILLLITHPSISPDTIIPVCVMTGGGGLFLLGTGRYYQLVRGRWLYLYNNGFIYIHRKHLDAIHFESIDFVRKTKDVTVAYHGEIGSAYIVYLTNGRQLWALSFAGRYIEYHWQLYKDQLSRQQQQESPENLP